MTRLKKLHLIKEYFKFYFSSGNEHSIHSPFVFQLYNEVINQDDEYYAYQLFESIRARYLLDQNKIQVVDYGAGSLVNNSNQRSISSIARHSLVNPKKGRLLFRLANHFQPKEMLELGTSLGMSSMYLAGFSRNSQLTTLEGNPSSAEIAKANWNKIGLNNISCVTGDFNDTLPSTLEDLKNIDLAYIDGDHTYEATIKNCNLILNHMDDSSLMILDDIHWSAGMNKAWNELCSLEAVTISIDLFDLGLLFFKKDQEKEHFILRLNPKKEAS